jgi:hypothetical protein
LLRFQKLCWVCIYLHKNYDNEAKINSLRISPPFWTFCNSINEIPKAAKLHRTSSKDSKFRLGFLVAPSGELTQSEEETLNLILHTHFPDSGVVEEEGTSGFASRTTRLDWQVATKVVTYRRVVWAIETFVPYKGPGVHEIFPALLQEGREVLLPYLVRIFRACLATGYVPTAWRQVKVVFIPKPGRDTVMPGNL